MPLARISDQIDPFAPPLFGAENQCLARLNRNDRIRSPMKHQGRWQGSAHPEQGGDFRETLPISRTCFASNIRNLEIDNGIEQDQRIGDARDRGSRFAIRIAWNHSARKRKVAAGRSSGRSNAFRIHAQFRGMLANPPHRGTGVFKCVEGSDSGAVTRLDAIVRRDRNDTSASQPIGVLGILAWRAKFPPSAEEPNHAGSPVTGLPIRRKIDIKTKPVLHVFPINEVPDQRPVPPPNGEDQDDGRHACQRRQEKKSPHGRWWILHATIVACLCDSGRVD